MPLAPGTRIGSYEIIAPLGAGGMGEVYRARRSSRPRRRHQVPARCICRRSGSPDAFQSLKTGTRRIVLNGGSDARVLSTGHLLYRYGGILHAVPFDARTLAVNGNAVPVIEGVMRASAGPTQMALSAAGTIAYAQGPTGTSNGLLQLTIGDRAGVTTPVALPPGPFVDVRVSPDGKQVALGSEGRDVNVWAYALDGRSALRRVTLNARNRFPCGRRTENGSRFSPSGVRSARIFANVPTVRGAPSD